MVESQNIIGRKNEIKDYVASADISQAVKRLIDFMRDFCIEMEDEAIILSMNFNVLDQKQIAMTVMNDSETVMRNQIAFNLLKTLNKAYTQIEKKWQNT